MTIRFRKCRGPIARLLRASGLVLAVLGIPSVSADPQPTGARLPIVATGPTAGVHLIASGNNSQTKLINGRRNSSKHAVLSEFVLTATAGDHHIERIGVDVNGGSLQNLGTEVAFHNKRDDRCSEVATPGSALHSLCTPTHHFGYDFRIGLYEFDTDRPPRVKFSSCKGECKQDLGAPPAGHTFVLSAFNFVYSEENKYVRRVSVLPYASPGKVLVRFHDNGTPKFHGYVHGMFIENRFIKVAKKEVTVQYTPGKPVPKVNIGHVAFALVGFDFEFLNGDHKLQTIGFKYERPYLIPKLADKNTDDPWKVKVQYVVLTL